LRFPLILIAASLGLAACSTPPKPAPAAAAPAPAAASPGASAAQPAAAAPAALTPEYLDPSSAVAKRRSVYFGFDDNTIRQQDRDVIELQGRYLASHPNVSVRVEGNTDERGSAEYNLALGQRRADATAKALEVFGARSSQLDSTSWGAEKPVAAGHDEAAWAQNRRADVVYPSK
jgi:peptidoglycan-associated lipoprotein